MKKNPDYSLQLLEGAPTLVPFGQAVADRRQALGLEGAGLFLWEALDRASDREQLWREYRAFARPAPQEEAQARQDMDRFLDGLIALGAVLEPARQTPAGDRFSFSLAGLTVTLSGPGRLFPGELLPFAVPEPAAPDLYITLTEEAPVLPREAVLTLRSPELEIHRWEGGWLLSFPQSSRLLQGEVSPDGRTACFTVSPVRGEEAVAALREEIFHAIRPVFLLLARSRGVLAMHGVSLDYRDRAWLFSAPAGTGKSTHARLWEAAFGTPQINGDLALLAFSADGAPTLLGCPWCGTSGLYTTKDFPVGGITLLVRGQENTFEALSPARKQLLVANRLISPCWTREMLEQNLAFAGRLARAVPVWRYHCTKEPDAARVMKGEIDRCLEEMNAT